MSNEPWDKLASAIEQARLGEQASFHWPSYSNRRYWVWIEWNGGLPIIGVDDLMTGECHGDMTAFQVLRLLEDSDQEKP